MLASRAPLGNAPMVQRRDRAAKPERRSLGHDRAPGHALSHGEDGTKATPEHWGAR